MYKKIFSNNFLKFRKKMNLSQNMIAEKLGISVQAVSNWERNISFPDISYLSDISKILDTNVVALLFNKKIKRKINENINFNQKRLASYLAKLRKNKHLTQKDLSKMLNVTSQNISKYENETLIPSVNVLLEYASFFNISFLNLYYGLDDEDLFVEREKKSKIRLLLKILVPSLLTIFVSSFILGFIIIKNINDKNKPSSDEICQVYVIIDKDNIQSYFVKKGETITLPEIPDKKGYTSYWDNDNLTITSDQTFRVKYEPKKYKITYVFDDERVPTYVQEVNYNDAFHLYKPKVSDIFVTEYYYNNQIFTEGNYLFDHDITILGYTSNELYTLNYQICHFYGKVKVGYGCEFIIQNYEEELYEIFADQDEEFLEDLDNYDIIGWRDAFENEYEIGETYVFGKKDNLVLYPIFLYKGSKIECLVEDEVAKIQKYNIFSTPTLIIPDYILIDSKTYSVTEILTNSFNNNTFNEIVIGPNIRKIHQDSFSNKTNYAVNSVGILYTGSIKQWFTIDFDDCISSNNIPLGVYLHGSFGNYIAISDEEYILEIPDEIIKLHSYSLLGLNVKKIILSKNLREIEKRAFFNCTIQILDYNNNDNSIIVDDNYLYRTEIHSYINN